MREIKIEKLTLNIGAGKDQSRLDKSIKLLKSVVGKPPVKTFAKKRTPEWGLRPGLPIGCKITLRDEEAIKMLKRLLEAKDKKLEESNFDSSGNVSFGVKEYIDIPDVKYDPDIGIMGLDVSITLERPGFRVKRRKKSRSKVGKNHHISKEDAIKFMNEKFGVEVS